MTDYGHQSVLLEASLDALNIQPSGTYVDATFGRGGHSGALLERLGESGRLIAMDRDPQAVEYAKTHFAGDRRFTIEHCNFSQVKDVIEKLGLSGRIDGVLMDLGVSSPQLDDADRGFSFLRSGPLDMRMDTSSGETAAHWLARVSYSDLVYALRKYGEEKFAKRIAAAVVDARAQKEITTTAELAAIIEAAVPIREKNKHPATRSFQAIRIVINDELKAIEQGLENAVSVLAPGGRLAVISFHSLEDRIVKRFMRDMSSRPAIPAGLPVMDKDIDVPCKLVSKPVVPDVSEIEQNLRARSARLRVLEKR